MARALESVGSDWRVGHAQLASATAHPLPDDAAHAFVTDPPYYDAVPYAYLSDFFYVWLRRTLGSTFPALITGESVPKDEEIVVDRQHELSTSTKDIAFYEANLQRAFADGRRVLMPEGIGTIVFASKTTASWEAILQAMVDAGWVITASWPIDTEMASKVAAIGQARLMSSVHLVCRPRENPDGSLREDAVGDWRAVLRELPRAYSRLDAAPRQGRRRRRRRDLRLPRPRAGDLLPLLPASKRPRARASSYGSTWNRSGPRSRARRSR